MVQNPCSADVARPNDVLMLIDGRRVPAASGRTLAAFNPCTGEVIGSAPAAETQDVDAAVMAASRAFETGVWRNQPVGQRAKVLWRAADLIDQNSERLAQVEALNSGMLLTMARMVVAGAAETARYYAGWTSKIHGLTADASNPAMQYHAYTLREPVGVCAAIVPWNVPITLTMTKVAAALAAGCSMIIKPAEETPFTALMLAELFHEAGLPPGVLNVVTGEGAVTGAALAAHDRVAKVAFTGSTDVGKAIVRAAAGNLKKVTLELGGKSPVVIFDDADLDKAAAGAAASIFRHAGQVCVAGSRLFAQRKVFDRVVEAVASAGAAMRVGDVFDPATQMGPLISAKQLDRVMDYIDIGARDGARLVCGGKRLGAGGFFMEPTVFAEPPAQSPIMREEIFGPVLAATPFDDLDEAVRLANDTHFGLSSAIWTRDVTKAHVMARRIDAGMVCVNTASASHPSLPGGGHKQSGWGTEYGEDGLNQYLQNKSVFVALD